MRTLPVFLLVILIIFSNAKSVYGADDFPYGCLLSSGGPFRIYTNHVSTETNGTRDYSPDNPYFVGTQSCQVTFNYGGAPFSGGCKVDGITTGSYVTITSVVDCPLDEYALYLLIVVGMFGYLIITRQNPKTLNYNIIIS
ncbi:hypothetical protein [Pedobacter miscanthi]|uniref:hypothetical protein n=1 Tax=Pedobacter miscanthi TaxID=2259170 RepID=UPI002931C9F6|nr:hypothetical protein [Pedobacter miscanthi]